MKHLNGITVLVLGLGESGLAMARWAARCGATVRVWDSRETPPNVAALTAFVPAATLLRGALDAAAFDGVRLVLKSPGLSPHDTHIAAPLDAAAETGVLVQGELELFAQALADLKAEQGYAPKLIAITGTNGKTTTTAMTALLVEQCGKRVAMAGNIGPTMLQTLSDALDAEAARPHPSPLQGPQGGPFVAHGEGAIRLPSEFEAAKELPLPLGEGGGEGRALPQVWVLELSSFQLDEVKGFEPDAATVLNITQDHLDWHGAMPAYVAAKARIFGRNAVMVINRDDPQVEKLVPEPLPPKGASKSAVKGRNARPIERDVVRFGLDAPHRPGDFGLLVENDMAWLVRALEADETIKQVRAKPGEEPVIELHIQRLMPADALRVRGRHNAANALAALALATAIGCPLAPLLHALREYAGEPHRVEFITTVNGVDAFDDSKGTNVGATVAALHGLGADKAPAKLVVILGGDGKGQDFTPLAEGVRRHARAVATIGRDAALIEQALSAAGVLLHRHDTLEAATRWCFEQAQSGDAVLLSPACASLDMFRNYAHRAEVFVAEVQSLAAEQGTMP
jgi:UDP-N-acetylmuramoylalanine--D-glutamate ligase